MKKVTKTYHIPTCWEDIKYLIKRRIDRRYKNNCDVVWESINAIRTKLISTRYLREKDKEENGEYDISEFMYKEIFEYGYNSNIYELYRKMIKKLK